MNDTIVLCRELLTQVTPLKQDCGRCCNHRCCQSLEGEETGMLLFPGEDELYRDAKQWRIVNTASGEMIVCPGTCDRDLRPLSCRLFPLLPLLRDDGIKVAMDARAKAVCPLASQGVRSLAPEFIENVRECGKLLCSDPQQKAFLQQLTQIHDELKLLQNDFTTKG